MRVLVVEDNEKLGESLRKGLEQEGYAVDRAHDGMEATSMLDTMGAEYDVVVLDLMIPFVDGMAVCRHLRSAGHSMPVLMLTARDGVEDRVDGLDAGADDYLTKPFAFDELAARIRALLRRPRVPTQPVLVLGNVEADPATRTVTVKGGEVALTTKEFGILELLLRHPRQVLSRDQITRHLWNQDFEGSSNVVEVHVKNVRKKLTEAGTNARIETVRGAGYRITD
jgi:DNA-binding response OmpR family regulator